MGHLRIRLSDDGRQGGDQQDPSLVAAEGLLEKPFTAGSARELSEWPDQGSKQCDIGDIVKPDRFNHTLNRFVLSLGQYRLEF